MAFGRLIGLELQKVKDEAVKRNMKRKLLNVVFGDPAEEQPKVQYIVVGQDGLQGIEM